MSRKYGKIKNPKIKSQWIKDLRSGNYKQCAGSLCEMGARNEKASYCCLGVLGRSIQKIKALDVTLVENYDYSVPNRELSYKGISERGQLPDNLRKEIGIFPKGIHRLIALNDEDGANFKAIADFIEKSL